MLFFTCLLKAVNTLCITLFVYKLKTQAQCGQNFINIFIYFLTQIRRRLDFHCACGRLAVAQHKKLLTLYIIHVKLHANSLDTSSRLDPI